MFDSDRGTADITLCIFPHLREFIVVDAREDRPGGPAVLRLSISNILGEDFYTQVESDFSKIIRRHDIGFLELMSIPQQVEAIIRANSLKRIIAELGINIPESDHGPGGTVGVLFFAGSLLALEGPLLTEAMQELFGNKLAPHAREQLIDQLLELMEQERKSIRDTTRQDIASLISGKGGPYVTIWESSGN
ncbi:MAG: hypothetical protein IH960_05780 [Chloroflexi bacterium]|nr:hypothetical protein [Chloroflexota bacterium]MCH8910216.1 hypothetical protein [Chloroflexota bacterium]